MMKKNHIVYALIALLILSTIIGMFFGNKNVNEHFTTTDKYTVEYYYSEDCAICTEFRQVIDELLIWISFNSKLNFVEYKKEDSDTASKFDENNITEVPAIIISPSSVPFTGEKTLDNLKEFILKTTGLSDANEEVVVNPINDRNDYPADPVDPADPADPADPVDPVDPADPLDPADPVDPVDPADPISPIEGNLSSVCMNYSEMNQQCSSDEYNTAQCSSIISEYSSLKSEIDVLKSDLTNKETMLAGLKNNYEICQNCTNTFPLVTAACGQYFS